MDHPYHKVKEDIASIAQQCGRNPKDIQLVAVTKKQPIELIAQAYEAGCRLFGESQVQEGIEKIKEMPLDCKWHFIGTLQKNKVRKAIESFNLIHSVDSLELAQKIHHCAQERGSPMDILLQVNTSEEASKHGLRGEEWLAFLPQLLKMDFIRLKGLMTIAPLTEDVEWIRSCFQQLRVLKETFQDRLINPEEFKHLSMGMSHDYPIAIQEGATLVRVGSALFGSRSSFI